MRSSNTAKETEGSAWCNPNLLCGCKEILVALVLLPVGLLAMFRGENYFAILMAVFFMIAAYEFIGISRIGGYHPADFALYGTVLLMPLGRTFWPQIDPMLTLVFFVLAAGIYHLIHYERGEDQTIVDMAFHFHWDDLSGCVGEPFHGDSGTAGWGVVAAG